MIITSQTGIVTPAKNTYYVPTVIEQERGGERA